jgi:hypothetical protein
VDEVFARAGALRPAYEAVDWAATSLGPVESWSLALRASLDLLLASRFPITLLWGEEYVLVYNEAYVELIGDKHPGALGRPAQEVFPEAWPVIGPMMDRVRGTGEASHVEDEYLPLVRSGYLEECYFTFSYSAVRGPDGAVEGLIDVSTETTDRILTGRRLRLLTELSAALDAVDDVPRLVETAVKVLETADMVDVEMFVPGVPSRAVGVSSAAEGSHVADDELVPTGDERLWLRLPVTHHELLGARLTFRLNPLRRLDEDYRAFLLLVASTVARAADRVATATAERSFSTALQLSVLSDPVRSEELDVAVRYRPAVEIAQIGGDWYDSFRMPDGSLALVVGDVAGHDLDAAATMAQLRNLTRGIAHTVAGSTADVLRALDRTLHGLDVPAVATAVLVLVAADRRSVRWSNAGHLPPVLLRPDGRAEPLESDPDLLLGLDPERARAEIETALEPGATLVLYTDGLIERRRTAITDSIAWLTGVLEGQQHLTAEQLCNHLLAVAGADLEDDVALLVLRVNT